MVQRVGELYRKAFTGLPATVWWLSGVMLVHRAGTMVIPFLSLYLTQELGIEKDRVGFLIASYGAGGAVGALLGGWLSDRLGPRIVMAGSLLCSGVGLIVLLQINSFAELMVGLFCFALLAEAFRPANATALAQVCPQELHSRGFALQRLAVNLGMTVGPAIGGYLAEVRYSLLFYVNSCGCIVTLAFLLFVVPRFGSPGQRQKDRDHARATSPWRDRQYLAVMACLFINALVFVQIFATLPVYYKEVHDFTEHLIGWIFAVNTILIVATEMVLVYWLDRFSKLRVVAAGSAFLGLGLVLMPFGSSFSYAILCVLIWTIGEMISAPFAAAYAMGRAPEGQAGRYMGLFTLVFALAHMLSPLGGLLIYQELGPNVVWYVCCGFTAAVILPLWVLGARAVKRFSTES